MQFWEPANLLKKPPTQVKFSCEICKLFKNNYFEEHLWTSASKLYLKRDSNTGDFLWILWIIQEHLLSRGSTSGWFWSTSAGSFFNKVASLTAWRHLTVLEETLAQVFLFEFCGIFRKSFFAEKFLATMSHMFFFFSFLQISEVRKPKINLFVGELVN